MAPPKDPFSTGGFLEGLHAGAPCKELYEWCQRNMHECEWAQKSIDGPDHLPVWRVTLCVRLYNFLVGAKESAVHIEGHGSSVKRARDVAAAAALDQLDVGWRARLAAPASAGALQQQLKSLSALSLSSSGTKYPTASGSGIGAPGGPHGVLAPGYARAQLNELCALPGWTCKWGPWQDTTTLVWNTTLWVLDGAASIGEFSGRGLSKAGAQDAAAAKACAVLMGGGPAARVTSLAQRRSLAQVGDAAMDLLVAMRGRSAGLDAAGADRLRQRLLNNHALGGGPAAATEREAAIGTAVCAMQTLLTVLIESAVSTADPDLLAQLHQAL
jgi:hypothetical protein